MGIKLSGLRVPTTKEAICRYSRVFDREVCSMADLNSPKVQKILHSKAFAHLATVGAKGEPHSSVMWFLWDGEYIKFTHTTERQKYQNLKRDPRVAISITDVDDPYIYAEFR